VLLFFHVFVIMRMNVRSTYSGSLHFIVEGGCGWFGLVHRRTQAPSRFREHSDLRGQYETLGVADAASVDGQVVTEDGGRLAIWAREVHYKGKLVCIPKNVGRR